MYKGMFMERFFDNIISSIGLNDVIDILIISFIVMALVTVVPGFALTLPQLAGFL